MEIRITRGEFREWFRQTDEFVFLDEFLVKPGISAEGMKQLTGGEWYFRYHFPNNPMMPGVFQMESIMQSAGLIINAMDGKKEKKLWMSAAKDIKILKAAKPSDVLRTHVEMESYRRGVAWFTGVATVNGENSCKMRVSLICPDELGV